MSRSWTTSSLLKSPAARIAGLAALSLVFREHAALLPNVLPQVRAAVDALNRVAQSVAGDGEDVVPVVVVAIDDDSATRWNLRDATPADRLQEVIEVVARAHPAAVVVDIDVSDEARAAPVDAANTTAESKLLAFVKDYRGKAPLIFVKGVRPEGDALMMSPSSSFDAILTGHPSASWAHAHFFQDSDGITRRWTEALRLCDAHHGSHLVLSVAERVLATADGGSGRWAPPLVANSAGWCSRTQDVRSHPLIRSEGHVSAGAGRLRLSRLPAWTLTEPGNLQRDDESLFGGQVVVIGATHDRATDRFSTAEGTEPGVDIVADSVRFAPHQLVEANRAGWVFACLLIVSCWARIRLRSELSWSVALGASALIAWYAIGRGRLGILHDIELAMMLFLQIVVVDDLIELGVDVRDHKLRAALHARYRKKES